MGWQGPWAERCGVEKLPWYGRGKRMSRPLTEPGFQEPAMLILGQPPSTTLAVSEALSSKIKGLFGQGVKAKPLMCNPFRLNCQSSTIQASDDFVRFRREAINVHSRCLRVWQ